MKCTCGCVPKVKERKECYLCGDRICTKCHFPIDWWITSGKIKVNVCKACYNQITTEGR